MDRNGQQRDQELWNIATDAIINANLERDGFKIKDGYVNMPEALNYSAEEFYEKLLKEKQAELQQRSENGQSQRQNGDGQQDKQNGQGNVQSDEKSQAKNGQGGSDGKQDNQGQEQGADSSEQFADDHSLWEKAFEESQEQGNRQKNKSGQNRQSSQVSKNSQIDPNAQIPEFDKAQFDGI